MKVPLQFIRNVGTDLNAAEYPLNGDRRWQYLINEETWRGTIVIELDGQVMIDIVNVSNEY